MEPTRDRSEVRLFSRATRPRVCAARRGRRWAQQRHCLRLRVLHIDSLFSETLAVDLAYRGALRRLSRPLSAAPALISTPAHCPRTAALCVASCARCLPLLPLYPHLLTLSPHRAPMHIHANGGCPSREQAVGAARLRPPNGGDPDVLGALVLQQTRHPGCNHRHGRAPCRECEPVGVECVFACGSTANATCAHESRL